MIKFLKDIYNLILIVFRNLINLILFLPRFLSGIIILVILIFLIQLSLSDNSKKLTNGIVLYLPLKGYLVEEKVSNNDIRELLFSENNIPQIDLQQLLGSIEHAKYDDRITGIVIELSDFLGGYPSDLIKVSKKIEEFLKSGKDVTAYADFFSQSSYIIASPSSKIISYPSGGVLLEGFTSKRVFYKDLFDKVGLEVVNLSEGQFKTAFENLTLSSMSDEDKSQRKNLLETIWLNISSEIEKNRNLESGSIKYYLDNLDYILADNKGDWGQASLKTNFIDELMNREEFKEYLNKLYVNKEIKELKKIDYREYKKKKSKAEDNNIIAIISLSGPILDGYQTQGVASGENISDLLLKAKEDKKVKAIVLRVNTPGGSVFASELIRDNVLEVKKEGIPIITSMGGVAASGGYWVAASSDYIFAEDLTITGSIGVASILFNAEETLNKIGINEDGFSSSIFSDIFSPILFDKPNARLINLYEITIENVYEKFINIVAEGRNITKEKVYDLAEGKVWIGKEALNLDLVDEIGSLEDAIKKAAEMANLEDYKVKRYIKKNNPLLDFLPKFAEKTGLVDLKEFNRQDNAMGQSFSYLFYSIKKLNDPKSLYYLCGTCILLN